ncbi:etoposide-induced protein 2.4 homolog [Euwallacea fornicatus]|uniref:etoposide-induced protein 2.4 homolog n=1 Tax=Euwallacea fornicatus TaxID=995702 RepID=UPI00338FD989
MDIKGISLAIVRGIYDSFKGTLVLFYLDKEINERARNRHSPSIKQKHTEVDNRLLQKQQKKQNESNVFHNVLQCALLNGGFFLFSVLLFEYLLFPGIDVLFNTVFGAGSVTNIWIWIKYFLLVIYGTVWILPLILLSKIINTLWFQDIADSAYRYSRGRPVSFPSISMYFADSIFSIMVQILFLAQATLTSFIPIFPLGYLIYIIQMSLLHALYSFEYKWFNMGWELHKRLSFIEENWPYFLGFGLPLTILTQLSESWVINGCVFSIVFPLFIISGNEANPIINKSNINLHLFSLVITTANVVFSTMGKSKKLGVVSSGKISK